MIPLHFVCDGERDFATMPHLIATLLGKPVRVLQTSRWARLHDRQRKGFGRKLLFGVRQALDARASGLVAIVDYDKDPKGSRLAAMEAARTQDRSQNPAFPTVIGQAIPHGEVFLLDDPAAVRQALDLPGEQEVPNVRKINSPKEVLEALWKSSRRAGDEVLSVWADIARHVDPRRLQHADETGFAAMQVEVRQELGQLY